MNLQLEIPSEDSPSRQNNNSSIETSPMLNLEAVNSSREQLDQMDTRDLAQKHPQRLVEKIDEDVKNLRHQLPLDTIQERQSEFSQSMITNMVRANTNRSRFSRQGSQMGEF